MCLGSARRASVGCGAKVPWVVPENERRSVVVGLKARLVFLGVLAVVVLGAAGPASAALPTQGPFWHVEGSKLPIGASEAVTGKLVAGTTATLYATVGNLEIAIACTEAKVVSASISNSSQQGQDEATVEFAKCKVSKRESPSSAYEAFTGCEVKEPIKTTAVSRLWYHTSPGPPTERTNAIQDVFFPKSEDVFAKVTLKEGCGTAAGIHDVEGNVAAEVSPQYSEAKVGKLIFPAIPQTRVWRPTGSTTVTETQDLLVFEHEACLVAEAEAELTSGKKFGALE
jgi:hypothetical protein